MLIVLLLLVIVGMVIGFALAFIVPNGAVPVLLGGILVVITYIAIQITTKNEESINK